ncbi:MAG: branched-chain amino acid ABC transporter permease [Alphaproteobacteria bacterium]|nr:branched-chain amino acid ABC transporter permease [Alphaproteobacteria bacterium]MCW5743423.1 branched-chain amino acid ABC transporter permease [Alphaproteobacteria bacterium]
MAFFLEVLIGGLLVGVLYSLVALGFVLIFKASGVFNFAQGAMVLTAALALVRSLEVFQKQGLPLWLAVVCAFVFAAAVMALVAWGVERLVLRKLVNQEGIILFMATLGVTFFIDGLAQTVFGSDVYPLNLGVPKESIFILESVFDGGILVNELDIFAGIVAGLLVAGLALFFQRTRVGRALRAVADDHAAAQSVGIPLNHIWLIVWLVAGLVALVAGAVWGTKLGVQFSLSLLALKALPVLILGGFTSVPGAIIGGLVIGAGEKLAEVYIGPALGGGIEIWFAFVLALVFLLFRPQGLFGERIIERV